MSQIFNEPPYRRSAIYTLANILGGVCLLGFALDFSAIVLSPDFSSVEWRMGLMQQVGDRCFFLLFGAALLCYGLQNQSTQRKLNAVMCFVLGSSIALSSLFYLWDSAHFQSVAIQNLRSQQQKLEQKIQDPNASSLVIPGQIDIVTQQEKAVSLLHERTQALEVRATQRLRKTAVRTYKNFVLSAIGLLILGKLSFKLKFNASTALHPSSP